MNGKQLKNSILQWAIQGKLVPQDPNDEPASVLLERIREEKARLVKEKKIKKDKNESIIFRGDDNSHYEKFADGTVKCIDDEIPFEIPQSWCWARMSSVLDVRDGTHDTPNYVSSGYPLITGKDFYNGYFDLSKTQYISTTDYEIICQRSKVDVGDIIFSMIGGNIGSQILITEDNYFEMAIKNVALFKHYKKGMINELYLSYYLQSRVVDFKSIASGGAQSFVSLKQLRNYLIPIPSHPEQLRIVSRIEDIMPIADKYEKSQDSLDKLNIEIFNKLKKSVLQEAIQGKLVPQDPNDEPASVLLERIKEEKAKLFKEGKLKKKDLVDSVIFKGEDNKYYEIIDGKQTLIDSAFDFPESWQVVRLRSICLLSDGVKQTGSQVCLDAKYLRGKSSPTYLQQGKFVEKDDNIILVDGENSGEVFTAPIAGYMGSTFKQLWISGNLHLPYVLAFIRYYKDELRNSKKGAAIPHLNKDIFNNLIIGIPPYDEQVRIVDRLNSITSSLN